MSELLAFEWRRAVSIRTTWITSLFAILGVAFFAFVATVAVTAETGEPLDLPVAETLLSALTSNPFAIVLVSSLGAMAFGHEYRYGTIRLTLTAFPRRAGVFLAKLVMTLLLVFAVVALAVAAGYGVIAALGEVTVGEMSWLTFVWQVLVFATTYGVLAFAFTVITRNHPLGIVGPLLLFMLEAVMLPLIAGRWEWVPKAFPLTSMNNWFGGGTDATLGAAVWAAWMVGLLLVGYVLLRRRDA